MIISIDVETVCNVKGCDGYGTVKKCPHDHALHFKKNAITVIGACTEDGREEVFRQVSDLNHWLLTDYNLYDLKLIGHNFKFDFKTLVEKGAQINIGQYYGDTLVQAVAMVEKIPDYYLREYDKKRIELNKELGSQVHRKAGKYSLKTLAPYFAHIPPFWEKEDHNNEDYVLDDCRFTLQLFNKLNERLEMEGTFDFYLNKLMGWQRMITKMEQTGIRIDVDEINRLKPIYEKEAYELENALKDKWAEHYNNYYQLQLKEVGDKYKEMAKKAKDKAKDPTPEKLKKIEDRYSGLCTKALSKIEKDINLNSDKQKLWLFEKALGLDCSIEVWDKDLGERVVKKTTGKEFIEQQIINGREDFKLFKEWSDRIKILTGFFPSWLEKEHGGILYCSFNIGGTRTGRLSSSNPNLQQIPRSLRHLFIARPGHKLATFDMAAIEPNLIAFLSEDPMMCSLLISGDDFHNEATKSFFGFTEPNNEIKAKYKKERDAAKQCDLSILYGSGVNMLQTTAKKHGFNWNKNEAKQKLDNYRQDFDGVFQFKKNIDRQAENGVLTNIMGRKFKVKKQDIYMKAFNTLIQGGASDLVLESARRIQEAGFDVLALVHDEMVIEIPNNRVEEAKEVIELLMTDYKLTTEYGDIKLRAEGDVGESWIK